MLIFVYVLRTMYIHTPVICTNWSLKFVHIFASIKNILSPPPSLLAPLRFTHITKLYYLLYPKVRIAMIETLLSFII